MANTQLWNKLSTIVKTVLSESQDEDSTEAVMSSWNEQKSLVTKLLNGTSGRSQKLKKDPNAPKKPKTGYILFCMDNRDAVKSRLPSDTSAIDITRALGTAWNELPDKKKKKYETLAEKDKERYTKEMETYTPAEGSAEEAKHKKVRTGPKRPLTSYMLFTQEMREVIKRENPSLSSKEITSELGSRWRKLTDEQKAPYEARHAEAKVLYDAEKASMSESQPEKESKPRGRKPKALPPVKETPSKTKSARTVPIKKTPGYQVFSNEQHTELESDHPEWGERRLTTEINKMWRELNEDDRQAYEAEAEGGTETEDEESENELVEEDC